MAVTEQVTEHVCQCGRFDNATEKNVETCACGRHQHEKKLAIQVEAEKTCGCGNCGC